MTNQANYAAITIGDEEWLSIQSEERITTALLRATRTLDFDEDQELTDEEQLALEAEWNAQLGRMATIDLLDGMVVDGELSKSFDAETGEYAYEAL